jgi:hypothetical protein
MVPRPLSSVLGEACAHYQNARRQIDLKVASWGTSSLNVAESCLNVRTLTHLGAMRPEGVALTGIDTLARLGRKASELSRSGLFAFSGRRRQLGPVALKHVVARELEDL